MQKSFHICQKCAVLIKHPAQLLPARLPLVPAPQHPLPIEPDARCQYDDGPPEDRGKQRLSSSQTPDADETCLAELTFGAQEPEETSPRAMVLGVEEI